ncbi:MAG: SemiSWEET transporter [Nitrospinae bacterium]|nr:SemiSWEET transporter [Nitrospinota bacterium]
MSFASILGYLAGTLTTLAFVPQVVKTWKSKSTADISLGMFVTFCVGVFLWLVYGFLLGSPPIIAANVATLVLAMIILFLKIKYK